MKGNIDVDPAVSVTSAIVVADELRAVPARTGTVAEQVILTGAPRGQCLVDVARNERPAG
jgi:hypothetical protein